MALSHHTFRRLWHRALFGPVPLLRWLLRVALADRLRTMQGVFEPAFYLGQIPYTVQRRMAARDPALHYLLVGAALGRLPAPLFDRPRARELHPGVPPHRLLDVALTLGRPPLLPTARLPDEDPRPGVLLLDHARGGGSSQFLDLLADRLDREGERVIRTLRLDEPEPRFAIGVEGGAEVFALGPELAELVERFAVTRLVVNHVIDLPLATVAGLPALARELGVAYEVILHDYLAACPRVNLVDAQGRYCALPDLASCQACVAPLGISMPEWRGVSAALLHGASRVTVPSRDLAVRMAHVFGDIPLDVWSPEREPEPMTAALPVPAAEAPLALVVIGALNRPKGYDVVHALAREVARRGLPVTITLLGYSSNDAALRAAGVTVTGRYRNAEARRLLLGLAPDLVLFPAIWPETWSFTLTHALAAAMDIAAFDLGAIADRLRGRRFAHLLAPELAQRPAVLLDRLLPLAQARRERILRQRRETRDGRIMPPRLATAQTAWSDPSSPEGCTAPARPASPQAAPNQT